MQKVKDINKDLLQYAGIELENSSHNIVHDNEFYAIHWPDGSLRWLFKVDGFTPGFLAFYPAGTIRAKIRAFFMRLVGAFGFMGFFAKKIEGVSLLEDGVLAKSLKEYSCETWALFAGTPGADRKLVLAIKKGNIISKYIKVPISVQSQALVNCEFQNIEKFRKLKLKTVILPTASFFDHSVVISNVNKNDTSISQLLNNIHIKGLSEVYKKSRSKLTLKSYIEHHLILKNFKSIEIEKPVDPRINVDKVKLIAKNAIRRINELVLTYGNRNIYVSFAHRDFTPWNSLISKDSLIMFDLELAKPNLSYGFDLFHFSYQTELMQNRLLETKNTKNTKNHLIKMLKDISTDFREDDFKMYSDLYFLYHISEYLLKYIRQPVVHKEVFNQIDSWLKL
ncbi:hypothetical protein H4J46_10525 [Colwellia sp. MB02u-6]|uniref:hypothetical protein n=1 Tax=Colwellia sp. MB02u-6 TaxID=2759824 RepID=UPI0015F3928E|nr:hypothetical protein [Colwellia sp. MB02u-6]MBA6328370.1 hypothetical protein [Colwellia sp. MB02u-6]